jgi:hypothetical protein
MNFLGRGNFGVVFGGGKKGKGSRRLLGLGLYGITTTAMMKTCFMHSSRHHIINTAEDLECLLSCFEKGFSSVFITCANYRSQRAVARDGLHRRTSLRSYHRTWDYHTPTIQCHHISPQTCNNSSSLERYSGCALILAHSRLSSRLPARLTIFSCRRTSLLSAYPSTSEQTSSCAIS